MTEKECKNDCDAHGVFCINPDGHCRYHNPLNKTNQSLHFQSKENQKGVSSE